MKSTLKVATSLMAVAMMTVPMMALAQSSQQGNVSMQQSNMNEDWSTAPAGMTPDGYKAGIDAAKLDKLVQRPMDPKLGAMYKNPPVSKSQRDAYRAAFVAGYQAAVQHGATASSGN
jgi:hypothetical protein